MAVILHSCSMTVSLATQADFKIIDQTNYTITAQCQLVAPLDQRFVNDVPWLQIRGGDQFEFIQIQAVLGDRFRGYQFPDENRVLLWATFLIRNFTDSDLFQSSFDCYQYIYGKNMSVGYGLRTWTEDTYCLSNTSKYATNPVHRDLFHCSTPTIFIGISALVAVLTFGEKIRKLFIGGLIFIFRKLKAYWQRAEKTSPATSTPVENSCAVDMESVDPKEHSASRVGAPPTSTT